MQESFNPLIFSRKNSGKIIFPQFYIDLQLQSGKDRAALRIWDGGWGAGESWVMTFQPDKGLKQKASEGRASQDSQGRGSALLLKSSNYRM